MRRIRRRRERGRVGTRVIIKVCGVRTAEVAEAAVAAGADWIGVVLDPRSPRFADEKAVHEVAAVVRGRADLVGVMVNPSAPGCNAAIAQFGLDAVQVHGDMDRHIVADIDVCVIRGVNPPDAATAFAVDWWPDGWLLLDAPSDGDRYGGTGIRADVAIAAGVARHRRMILAGGLDADNVGAAIAAVRPAGVDASSRLELTPGVKDVALVRRYVEAARSAQAAVLPASWRP